MFVCLQYFDRRFSTNWIEIDGKFVLTTRDSQFSIKQLSFLWTWVSLETTETFCYKQRFISPYSLCAWQCEQLTWLRDNIFNKTLTWEVKNVHFQTVLIQLFIPPATFLAIVVKTSIRNVKLLMLDEQNARALTTSIIPKRITSLDQQCFMLWVE